MLRFLLAISIWCSCYSTALATVPALEREITLQFSNERLGAALAKIQEQAGIIFSYPSSILNNIPPVSLQLRQKTVREALALILPKGISFKARNNYIILKEKPPEKNPKKTELSGYVYDRVTEKKIANVTLYDKTTLQTVTTNEYGYYSISLPKEEQCLTVNKENYRDTCVSLTYLKDSTLTNISIDQVSDNRRDSTAWETAIRDFSQATNNLFRRFKGYVNTINVKDTITRRFQVSLLPFVGTNGLLSGNVYNKYSINAFGGYSRGTRGLEMGGFFNIDREKASGAQLAGFCNVVGDSMQGVQLAGALNITGKRITGLQAAGGLNMNLGGGSGTQLAGIANLDGKSFNGVAVAGFINITHRSAKGVLLAGFMNLNLDTLEGFSMAGFMNVTRHSRHALQAAGSMNYAHYGENNLQLAGLVNTTETGSSAIQVAAFNRTQLLTGFQLGLFNYSDSASGVPLGLLSIVKKGVHQAELSGDEVFYTNLSFRSGVNALYNIVGAGIQPGQNKTLWDFGYGLGTSLKLKNKLRADATAAMYHVSSGGFYFGTSELYKFYFGVEYRFSNKFSIAAGPTFNLYWSDKLLPDYESTYSKIAPYYSFSTALANDFNLKGWFGARIALRFF